MLCGGERVGAAVVSSSCTNEVTGSSPGVRVPGSPLYNYAFGFQSMLASAGFSPGTPAFLPHSKLTLDLDSLASLLLAYLVPCTKLDFLGESLTR